MSQSFQNRLVGTVVLVALCVIFLPDLLGKREHKVEEIFPDMPNAPAFSEIRIPEGAFEPMDETVHQQIADMKEEKLYKALPKVQSVTIQKNQNRGATQVSSSLNNLSDAENTHMKDAWALQVGSFKSVKNVEKLIAKLRLNGFSVYTIPRNFKDQQLTKVYVGPHVSREAVITSQKEIEKLVNMTGVIVQYVPLHSL